MKKRTNIMIWVVIVVAIVVMPILWYIQYHNMIRDTFQEVIEQTNHEMAIKTLSEFRGKVKMIEYISWSNAGSSEEMQEQLHKQLEDIIKDINEEKSYKNYLEDFNLSITTSEIGDICEEITSQIDEKLHTILCD